VDPSWSGRYGEENNLAPTAKRTPAVQPVARHYTDGAIPIALVTGLSKPNRMMLILPWVFNDAFMKEIITSDCRMIGEP
jgi:hypothetical protein